MLLASIHDVDEQENSARGGRGGLPGRRMGHDRLLVRPPDCSHRHGILRSLLANKIACNLLKRINKAPFCSILPPGHLPPVSRLELAARSVDESTKSCENSPLVLVGSPRAYWLPFRESSSGGKGVYLAANSGFRVWANHAREVSISNAKTMKSNGQVHGGSADV